MAKRILVVSDCPTLNTGYARVSRFVATTLQDAGYRVRYLPCNATMENSGRTFNFELDKFDVHQRYNNSRIGEVLATYKPSLVMVFGEFNFVGYIGNVCRQLNIRSMYYFPIEGEGYPPHIVYLGGGHVDFKLTLMKFHYIVAYSEFGARNINNLMPGIVTDTIPHQVDTSIFRPLDKKACLNIFFPSLINNPDVGMEKMFIVGGVYRNMRRKGLDYFMKAMQHLIHDHEKEQKFYGFLVTDPRDAQGYNLEKMIEHYNLGGRMVIHPVTGGKEGPEDNQLCEIYNTFDVHLCPFRAEGFGIPIIESLACGVRTVCTNFATPANFGAGVCDFVDPVWLEPVASTNCEWAVLNPEHVAKKVADIYNHGYTKDAYQPGVDLAKKFDDKVVGQQWVKLLNDLDLPDMSDIDEKLFQGTTQDEVAESYFDTLG